MYGGGGGGGRHALVGENSWIPTVAPGYLRRFLSTTGLKLLRGVFLLFPPLFGTSNWNGVNLEVSKKLPSSRTFLLSFACLPFLGNASTLLQSFWPQDFERCWLLGLSDCQACMEAFPASCTYTAIVSFNIIPDHTTHPDANLSEFLQHVLRPQNTTVMTQELEGSGPDNTSLTWLGSQA